MNINRIQKTPLTAAGVMRHLKQSAEIEIGGFSGHFLYTTDNRRQRVPGKVWREIEPLVVRRQGWIWVLESHWKAPPAE